MAQRIEQIDSHFAVTLPGDDLLWYDAQLLDVEGQGWLGDELSSPFDRLPARAQGVVEEPVWILSRDSAGLCVRFVSDSGQIAARWTLTKPQLAMNHMPATGVSGMDLYLREDGRWRWIGAGKGIDSAEPRCVLFDKLSAKREFALYLPLYNGVSRLQIGIQPGSTLIKAPPRTAIHRPIVFYGTSVVQGGCASRPGMAYPAILGRWLDCETVNLGFSGNGKMQQEVLPFLAELDPEVFVLDCVGNLAANPALDLVAKRVEPFVRGLRQRRPNTPIVLMESFPFQNTLKGETGMRHQRGNQQFREAYDRLLNSGTTGLHYIPGDRLLGDDYEATVDGIHFTDLGFARFAEAVYPFLKPLCDHR